MSIKHDDNESPFPPTSVDPPASLDLPAREKLALECFSKLDVDASGGLTRGEFVHIRQ